MNKSDLAKIARVLKLARLEIAKGRTMSDIMDERELYDSDPIPSYNPDRPVKSVRVSNTAVSFEQLHPKRWGEFNAQIHKDVK